MIRKYTRLLEQHEINVNTGEVWKIQDVPNTWRARTKAAVEADGYVFDLEGVATKEG